MSKRVSNKRGYRRVRYARSQVKYGWKQLQLFAIHGKEDVLSGKYLLKEAK